MDFFEESLDRVKSIVRLARRYRLKTGLTTNLPDLVKARQTLIKVGLSLEAMELEEIIDFLLEEENSRNLTHKKLLDKTKELSDSIPIGMLVNFRFEGSTLTGELLGFLADRALIRVGKGSSDRIYEVSPFDLKT